MRKFVIVSIYLFLFSNILLGQFLKSKKLSFDLGVVLESGLLLVDKSSENSITGHDNESSTLMYPLSVYLSGRLNFSNSVGLELRSGLFFGGEEYFGSELGIFIRYQIIKDRLFAAGGLNFHFNAGSAHNGFTSSEEVFTFLGMNMGVNLSKNVAFMVSYYYQPKKNYLFNEYEEFNTNYKLKDVVKFGFDYTL